MLRLAMLAALVVEYVETCSAIMKLVCGNAFLRLVLFMDMDYL